MDEKHSLNAKVISVVSARGILYLPAKGVLLLKRSSESTASGFWELPGGKFDQSDMHIRTALALEFLEETKIPVSTINAPVYLWDEPNKFSNNGSHYMCIIYQVHCKYPYVDEVKISNEHESFQWVKLPNELKELDGNGVYNETRRALDRFYQDYIVFPQSLKQS